MNRTIILRQQSNAEQLWAVLKEWPAFAAAGHFIKVRLTEATDSKTRDQEEKYHAMIADIAKQCK